MPSVIPVKIRKTDNWDRMIAWIRRRDKNFKGKKEKIDHDLIAYGVSRNGTTIEEFERTERKKTKRGKEKSL